jgi:DNA-binding MarR family transcriptional regulator
MAKIPVRITPGSSRFTAYLTFKLDLVKSEMLRGANLAYRREFGLDVRSLRVLRAICDNPGVTSSGLRDLTLIEKTILSKVLADLIARKLIRRSIHPAEARHHQLWATPSGKCLRDERDDLGHSMEDEMLSVLSRAEQSDLNRLLDKLASHFLANASQKTNEPRG